MKRLYHPKENIEHVYQLTALALIMSSNEPTCRQMLQSEYFAVPLLKDIKYCLSQVSRINPEFLRLISKFCSYTLKFKARD